MSLSALHVSDSLVHHYEQRFGAVYRNWYMPVHADTSGCCVVIATQQPDVWYRLIQIAIYGSNTSLLMLVYLYLSIYLSIRFHNSCRHLPETKLHSSLFLH